jgi:hypothetical protein
MFVFENKPSCQTQMGLTIPIGCHILRDWRYHPEHLFASTAKHAFDTTNPISGNEQIRTVCRGNCKAIIVNQHSFTILCVATCRDVDAQ